MKKAVEDKTSWLMWMQLRAVVVLRSGIVGHMLVVKVDEADERGEIEEDGEEKDGLGKAERGKSAAERWGVAGTDVVAVKTQA